MGDPPNVYAGMAQVLAALSHIPKGRASGVNYEFRSIDALMNALHGPLADAGLFLVPRVLDDWQVNAIPGTNNRTQYQAIFRVECDVVASDGTTVTLGPGLAQSHDYGDKAVYQAQQNALKYLLLEAFCIPTAEADMDGREPDHSSRDVPADAPVQKRLEAEAGGQVNAVAWAAKERYGKANLKALTDDQAAELLAALRADRDGVLEQGKAAAKAATA